MKARLFLPILLLFCCVFPLIAGGKSDSSPKSSVAEKSAADKAAVAPKEVVVYAYDSFLADWGPGPELVKGFEAATGYRLTMISAGDAVQVLSRAAAEKNKPQADVLVGIDNQLASRARDLGVLQAYKPAGADNIVAKELRLADDWLLTPYDWSYFAFIWDSKSPVAAPASLDDLLKSDYRKKIILMDPRMSTPGVGFVAWTVAVYGDKYLDYWKALKPNILTMAPGWDSGYGLFTAGEAPLVLSYTTSPAYHVEYDKTDRYKALIFKSGHIAQVEGAGLVKGAKNTEGGKAFLDYLISVQAQEVLPLTQWMYPINQKVQLPESYKAAPKAEKTLKIPADLQQKIDAVIAIVNN